MRTTKDDEAQARRLESETLEKVSESISKIEVALADWDALERQPEELSKRMGFLKETHRILSAWARETLQGKKDFDSVTKRLDRFRQICKKIAKRQV
jgi:hypothetical protein